MKITDKAHRQGTTGHAFTLEEAEREFKIPVRKLSYLIRRHAIEPAVHRGKLHLPKAEMEKYLDLPERVRDEHHASYIKTLGPGIITGASDDDPSGIATYSVVGASYGLGLSWLALYLLPMMTAVQETVARIGIVTGKGLTVSIGKHYGRGVLYPLILLLFIANTINIGADIGAIVASLQLLAPVNFYLGVIGLTAFMVLLEVIVPYHRYAKILKWLTVSLMAYVVTGFIIRPDWLKILKNLAVPHISFNASFLAALVAVMGTTISPYLFFWQASEEVEEMRDKHLLTEHHKLAVAEEVSEMRKDTYTGMSFASVVFLFIVITTAFVLHDRGITSINTAADAAAALKPLAGNFASLLFAVGVVGVGLLAAPVLAGSSAYAIAELFKWHEGLSTKYSKAKGFYGVIIWSMLIGMAMNFIGLSPIKALYYAAIINGIASPVIMLAIFKLGNDRRIMGDFVNPRWVNVWGYIATALMGGAAAVLIVFGLLGI